MEHIYVVIDHESHGPVFGDRIHAAGLHGLLFHVLQDADPVTANRLHQHRSPKPFSLVPLFGERGELHALRIAALTGDAGETIAAAWLRACKQRTPLRLGPQPFTVKEVVRYPGAGFALLATARPAATMHLRFLSPTSFKQGHGSLPLPLPRNVFHWPLRVWDEYAPEMFSLPADWLEWCDLDVFVIEHDIQTVCLNINKQQQFSGFVGTVALEARTRHPEADLYLGIWQALGQLATFSGVGHRTTMGMGAVEVLP